MLDKIEVGEEYIDEDGVHIKVLDIGDIYVIGYDITSNLKYFITITEALYEWSELQKQKIKRAKYLCKYKTESRPFETIHFHIDCKDFLNSIVNSKKDFDFIRRMQETEREFDE